MYCEYRYYSSYYTMLLSMACCPYTHWIAVQAYFLYTVINNAIIVFTMKTMLIGLAIKHSMTDRHCSSGPYK